LANGDDSKRVPDQLRFNDLVAVQAAIQNELPLCGISRHHDVGSQTQRFGYCLRRHCRSLNSPLFKCVVVKSIWRYQLTLRETWTIMAHRNHFWPKSLPLLGNICISPYPSLRAQRNNLFLLANQALMDRRVATLLAMTDLCRPSLALPS